MGLDQYLYAGVYVGGGYPHIRESKAEVDKKEVKVFDAIVKHVGLNREKFPEMHSAVINLQVAYWRKANAIHGWFVRRVQNGVDDCGSYELDTGVLRDLLADVTRVLDTVELGEAVMQEAMFGPPYETYPDMTLDGALAMELLPPAEGFFFGSADLDSWYVKDLMYTKEQLLQILATNLTDFTYRSSW